MAEQLVRMLKLMAGPQGIRPLGKVIAVSETEAKQLIDGGIAEDATPKPGSKPSKAIERAVTAAPERAVHPVQQSSASSSSETGTFALPPVVEDEATRRARYITEARELGVDENDRERIADDRLMFEIIVADGETREKAALSVWGSERPALPWVPQLVEGETDPATTEEDTSLLGRASKLFGRKAKGSSEDK